VFSVLATARLYPQPKSLVTQESQQSLVAHIKNVTQGHPVLPKPNIKSGVDKPVVKKRATLPNIGTRFTLNSEAVDKAIAPTKTSNYADIIWSQENYNGRSVRFFSAESVCRRVCFLVDCSGSMRGLMGRVKDELVQSIQSLSPDQYFGILFFSGDSVIKFAGGELVRASESTKGRAIDFIRSARPEGHTDALVAFESAIKMRDKQALPPEVIMFLTDGFELSTDDGYQFRQKILNLRQRHLAETVINTIGFWPSENDRYLLESIARGSGGEFVCVGE